MCIALTGLRAIRWIWYADIEAPGYAHKERDVGGVSGARDRDGVLRLESSVASG